MKQRLHSKMIPLQHGHHRAFLGGRVFQMEDGDWNHLSLQALLFD